MKESINCRAGGDQEQDNEESSSDLFLQGIWHAVELNSRTHTRENFTRDLTAEGQPEQLRIESEDGRGYDPSDDRSETRISEDSHLGAIARELHQRDHREGQLKAQHHLAQDQQGSDFSFAI